MFPVKQPTREKIDIYTSLLIKWQKSVNLISNKTASEIEQRHIQDSLQLLKFIPDNTDAIIDLGSGAGLPGIPLAIALALPTYLIESDRKKSLFQEEVARQLKLNILAINERVETAVIPIKASSPVITARAFAPLEKIFELVNLLLENNNIAAYKLILLKGKNVESEIKTAQKHWEFGFKLERSETDDQGNILIISQLQKK